MSSIGEILVRQGVVDDVGLRRAQHHAEESDGSLGQSLVSLGLANEQQLLGALAEKLDMPFVEVGPATVDPEAARMLDQGTARELGAIPVRFTDDGSLLVAIGDPSNRGVGPALERAVGVPVTLALSTRRQVRDGIAHLLEPGVPAGGRDLAEPPPPPGRSPAPSPGAGGSLMMEEDTALDLDRLLAQLIEREGSDLHLTAGLPPSIRVDGDITFLDEHPVLTPDELQKVLYGIMTQKQRQQFEETLELDMSYAVRNLSRFRVNVFQQRDSMGAVMRVIPFDILPLEKLGIPEQVANFAYLPRGFVLVTGPTGSGKSTTLAALVDLVNRNRAAHIMTVEDPIEFLHSHKRSIVNQREVGTDTLSFAAALKHVLRQDPDVILVGELRDLETIQIALTAAETGHLVFGTLHTQDAPQTMDRMIDVFPPSQQEQIRVQLAGAIQGVVSQTLLKRADGEGRIVATEVMMATSGIRNLIREGKTHQIYSSIQAGAKHGMQAMDQSLAQLVKAGRVSYDEALEKCSQVAEFNRLAGR